MQIVKMKAPARKTLTANELGRSIAALKPGESVLVGTCLPRLAMYAGLLRAFSGKEYRAFERGGTTYIGLRD